MNMKSLEALEAERANNIKKINQLENRQKILLNKLRLEEHRARTHRLIERGAIFESVFPRFKTVTNNEAVKAFLIALSHLPGSRELEENVPAGGTEE